MDVLSGALWIPIPPLCDYITHVCAIRVGGDHQGRLAKEI
jgi:hypothetical protein